MVKEIKYDIEYIKSVLDNLKKKGIEPSVIAQILSPPVKRPPLSILRERFKGVKYGRS